MSEYHVFVGSMNSAFSTLETVRWRKYVGDPNPHLVELIAYLITYFKDKRYIIITYLITYLTLSCTLHYLILTLTYLLISTLTYQKRL